MVSRLASPSCCGAWAVYHLASWQKYMDSILVSQSFGLYSSECRGLPRPRAWQVRHAAVSTGCSDPVLRCPARWCCMDRQCQSWSVRVGQRHAQQLVLCGITPQNSVFCCRRYGYPIRCTSFSKDAAGNVTELAAEYDAEVRNQKKKPPKVRTARTLNVVRFVPFCMGVAVAPVRNVPSGRCGAGVFAVWFMGHAATSTTATPRLA